MTGLVRRATLITAAGLLAATAVMAGVPSATTSVQPSGVRMVWTSGGNPDPVGTVATYTIRDASSNPVPGSVVIMNFAACTEFKLSTAAVAGMTVNCGAKTVTGVTNATGQVTFLVAGNYIGGAPVTTPGGCIAVTADGVNMNRLTASSPELNLDALVTPLDLSIAFGDVNVFTNTAVLRGRSDYDMNGTLSPLDLSAIFAVVNKGPWPSSPPNGGTDVQGANCP